MQLEQVFDEFTARDWRTDVEGTVRFAMIGLGWWTVEEAMPAVADAELCETTVVVSGSPEKAARIRDEHEPVERAVTYEEFHEGAAAAAYDAVYVCTPNAYHLGYVETAAELGKAVLCEKPMEASAERAEALVEAAEAGGIPLMVAYRMHTEPAVRRARDLLEAGVVGEPVHVHGHMAQRLLEVIPDPDQWRLDPDLSGPGTSVMDLGIYPLNTARFVLDADPVSVGAVAWSGAEGFEDVPDERASFTVEYDGRVLGSMSASQNAARSSHLRVVGTGGELLVEPAFFPSQPRALTVRRDGTASRVTFDQVDQMTEEFDYFADRVLGGGDVYGDGRHGLLDVRALEAVYEAAETGERVLVGE